MPRELNCELCGNNFECGSPGPCWCTGVRLTIRQRSTLSMLAKDCVCKDCLEKMGSVH